VHAANYIVETFFPDFFIFFIFIFLQARASSSFVYMQPMETAGDESEWQLSWVNPKP
jgi:hypothetical protein